MTPERLAALAAATTPDTIAAARLEMHGALGGDRARLAADVAATLHASLLAEIERRPTGRPHAELRAIAVAALRRATGLTADAAARAGGDAIDEIVETGAAVRDGEMVRLAGHAPSGPSPALLAAMDRLVASLDVASPPSLALAARTAGCPPDGIRALVADGRIVRLDEDLAYAAAAYAALEERAVTLAAAGPLAPAALRDATGTSRKYVMAILEDLDRRGVLRRTADGHVLGPRAAASAIADRGRP
jgi:selenocysteine-specific elongation factor